MGFRFSDPSKVRWFHGTMANGVLNFACVPYVVSSQLAEFLPGQYLPMSKSCMKENYKILHKVSYMIIYEASHTTTAGGG